MRSSEKMRYEIAAICFSCYGCPSYQEVVKLSQACNVDFRKVIRALRWLSQKGFVKIHNHPKDGCSAYNPCFFELTDKGIRLFQRNVAIKLFFLRRILTSGNNLEKAFRMLLKEFDVDQLR